MSSNSLPLRYCCSNCLPEVLQWVAYATPLWHGVDLCRGLVLGTIGAAAAVGHVAYLLVWVVGGLTIAGARYSRRLLK